MKYLMLVVLLVIPQNRTGNSTVIDLEGGITGSIRILSEASQKLYVAWVDCLQTRRYEACEADHIAFFEAVNAEIASGPGLQRITDGFNLMQDSLRAYCQCRQNRKWWQLWKPRCKWEVKP